jgi:hypothetical protein
VKIVASYRVCSNGEGWWFASIEGGPQDLIKRGTEEYALRDGEAYAKEAWGQDAEGKWTPYRAAWATKPGEES